LIRSLKNDIDQVAHNILATETSKNTAPKGALIALKKVQIQECTTVRLVSKLSVTAITSTAAYRIGVNRRWPSAKAWGGGMTAACIINHFICTRISPFLQEKSRFGYWEQVPQHTD
jgi:hypothetical protein